MRWNATFNGGNFVAASKERRAQQLQCARAAHRQNAEKLRLGRRRLKVQQLAQLNRHLLPLREPCLVCGHTQVEMHHPDYDNPYFVQWLCQPCHLEVQIGKAMIFCHHRSGARRGP